ncbi:hypothetical protein EV424DRAFT_1548133 [Suillus variegatus]|nr:hypothetical protein EV424DRAFT_1548133 [Suillus variegatus]
MIPPLLLSAAMELHNHLDPSTRQSFLSAPVWRNIVVNDPRIRNHPLHRKALKFIESSNQSASSPPPVHTAEHMILDAPADPPVGSIPKPKANPMRKKALKVVESSDSDVIEIIDHVVATNDIGPDNHRGKGKQTALPEDVDGDTLVEVVKADTVIVRQRPMLKRKQTQPTGGHDMKSIVIDRKGKGKEVPPPVNNVDGDGSAPLRRKRSRASSQNEQVAGSTPSATCLLVPTHTGDQHKPWFEQPLALPATVDHKLHIGKQHKSIHWRTPSMECTEDVSPEVTGDIAKESVVGTQSIDINMHMDIDVPADTMVKDLQAMTLEVKQDSVSVLKSHEEIYNTIHDLHNQVLELRAQNAAAAESLEALNVCVAAQDVEMRSTETLHTDVAMLQEQVRALHEESRTHDNQLHAADVKLASQGSAIAILPDAYEALRQCLIPTPSIPPHYNNTMFFPASHQHQPPYNQSLSVGQAQAMERMYLNFTPGLSMAAGPLVGTILAGASLPGAMHALPGPSTVAGPSLTSGMHAPSGPSGSHVTRSSQSTGNLGELASAFCRN